MSVKVNTKPVADNYSGPGTKIIEFTASDGSGGLISFEEHDGQVSVSLYRLDDNVYVNMDD